MKGKSDLKVLVLGSSGLIGSSVFKVLAEDSGLDVFGTVRAGFNTNSFDTKLIPRLYLDVDVIDDSRLIEVFNTLRPDVVINCVGATKHKAEGNHPISAIKLNALFPHRLAQLSEIFNVRLIHVSTDCVFSGSAGNYNESDQTDANDIYGKSKALGEVLYGRSLTLRTSTIGQEVNTNFGLLNWFLSQSSICVGFERAIFSGIPTVTFAKLIRDYVIPNPQLSGLYHVAASPINKYELLKLIAKIYNKKIEIQSDKDFVIDRSLDSTKFRIATGYEAPDWESLIKEMHAYHLN